VSAFAAQCACRLRQQRSCAGLVMVFIHTNPHRRDLPQYAKNRVVQLPVASNSDFELCRWAKGALAGIFRPGYRYKKAGVIVSGIVPERCVQTSLFDAIDRERQSKVLHAMDGLNAAYGRDTVRVAAQGFERKWKLRQERRSPSYTTRMEDLITVHC
jgi:DNA polymerase V